MVFWTVQAAPPFTEPRMTPSLALVPASAPAQQCLASAQETLSTWDSFAAALDGVEVAEAADGDECPAAAALAAAAVCAGWRGGAVVVAVAQPARTARADRTAAHAYLVTPCGRRTLGPGC
jgi:hypothetical protein